MPKPASGIALAGAPPTDTWNRFCFLRRTIDLDKVPTSIPARITADSRFVLYVNGLEVARGPARSIPQRLAWIEIDLAQHMKPGRNAIAVLARFYGVPGPWWRPAPPSYQLGYGSFAMEAPVIGVWSDASWKARRAPYRQDSGPRSGLPMPPIEILDGADYPHEWNRADFDDGTWENAVVLSAGTFAPNRTRIPVEPYSAPEAAEIAALTAIPLTLAEIARRTVTPVDADDPRDTYPHADSSPSSGDLAITYDAAGITLATPWVEVHGPANSIVDIYAGEDLRAGSIAEINPRRYAMRYVLGSESVQHVEAYEAVGFRYLTIVARGGAQIDGAGAVERRYPRSGDAHFECDDPALNKLWRVGARTLDLCSTDAFVDCPGREQRAWVGDSYVHALLTYVTNTDWRLVKRHLRICAQSRRGDGLLSMAAAGDLDTASMTIPDYSLHWIRALARYYEYAGDRQTIRELYPTAIEIANAFERYRADDGLIRGMPGWVFVDWAMTERAEATAALDALYAAAMEDLAAIANGVIGDAAMGAIVRERAERTRRAFEIYWDESRRVYVDAADANGPRRRVSQQTNAAAIVGGCAPRERCADMLAYVLDESRVVITPTISDNRTAYVAQRMDPAEYVRFDAERDVVAAQPFFSHLVNDAIVRAGRRDLIPARCMKWWSQIERGNTTFEEYWDAQPGTGSRCHAWSATPTYDLTTHVLGVKPAAPGFATVSIAPRFGALKHLEGRIPTPRGMIEVALDRNDGGELALPPETSARVSFEDVALTGGDFGPGRHRIKRSS